MARLIEKENVSAHGGDVVYLETQWGGCLVSILGFSYRSNRDGSETIHTVDVASFDEQGEYDMDDYGVTWRLWDVYVETPSVQQMNLEPWEVY